MSLLQILILIALYAFALQFVATALIFLLQKPYWLWWMAALVEASYLTALLHFLKRHRELLQKIGLVGFDWREALEVVLWLQAVALMGDMAIIWLAPEEMVAEYLKPFQPSGPTEWLALALVAIVLAPAIEEILFRGLLLHKLTEMRGKRFGVLSTTAAFALIHMVPLQILSAILPGLLLATYRAAGGSLYVLFMAHALGNTVSFLGLLFPGTPWISVSWEPDPLSGLLALLLTPLLGWLFLRRHPL